MAVRIWGSNQIPAAIAAAPAAANPGTYNSRYLKPLPGAVCPVARPGEQSSSWGMPAAATGAGRAPAASTYNKNYLEPASRQRYPLPRRTEPNIKSAFGAVDAAHRDAFTSAEKPRFTPASVLKLLKSLNTGDIPDEAKEEYEADTARLSAYAAAVATGRVLSQDEQAVVDKIGKKLTTESRELVAADAAAELAAVTGVELATQSRLASESRLRDAATVVAVGEAKVQDALDAAAEIERIRRKLEAEEKRLDTRIQLGEAHLANAVAAGEDPKKLAVKDKHLRHNKRKQVRVASARVAAEAELLLAGAEVDAANDDLKQARADEVAATAAAAVEATALATAKTARKSDPRFAAAPKPDVSSDLAAAIAATKPPPPYAEAKQEKEDLQTAIDSGVVKKFIEFNLGNNRVKSSKFVSNSRLSELWTEFARAEKSAPAAPPWRGKNRQQQLEDLFKSPRVPTVFKLRVLNWSPPVV